MKFPKINKRAGWNKAVQVGIFHFFISKDKGFGLKFPKINKRAGWNKAVQDRKFQFLLVKIKVLAKKFLKLKNVQDGISLCRMDFFQKRIRFCCTIIQETRVLSASYITVGRLFNERVSKLHFMRLRQSLLKFDFWYFSNK